MGLDILAYQTDGKRIAIFDFDEELHHIIFTSESINWDEYPPLYLIKDYYKANVIYEDDHLRSFIKNLENMRNYIPKSKQFKLDDLLQRFASDEISKVRITGD